MNGIMLEQVHGNEWDELINFLGGKEEIWIMVMVKFFVYKNKILI